jgi:fused signal recognition particle receptor
MGVAAAHGLAVKPGWWRRLAGVFTGQGGVAAARETAERILLEADFGVTATTEILERLDGVAPDAFDQTLERIVADLLGPPPAPLARAATPPTVILVFGVNGVGKTTTIAKLTRRLLNEGRTVLLAAADTFRPGAAAQLRIWADRLGVPCVGGAKDPAAVAFDAVAAAAVRAIDTVIVDTAGRLHTEPGLLDELKKVARVVGKRVPGAPHESLLVLDGAVGQNAVRQAVEFAAAVPLTGLVVTKLDGTAKGGSVVALRRAVPVPIRFLGTGEGLDDLEVFDAGRYARRLIAG